MPQTTARKLRSLLKWILWVVAVQFLLINISAALYAYKFTHLYPASEQKHAPTKNIFTKTWHLITGPKIYQLPQLQPPTFSYRNITLTTAQKISLAAWYSAVDSAKGCVLLFHGYTANKSYLAAEAAQFRNWGYNVLLVDFRAHGESSGSATAFGAKEAEEVVTAYQFAQTQGNKKILLYGVSMGAVAVLKAVAEKGLQPTAVIADMPFASLQDHLKSRARIIGFPAQPFAFLVTLWIGFERGFSGFSLNTCTYAKNIHCPVLLEWGEQDQFVSKPEIESIYNCLPAGQKKLCIYPTANHESYLQVDPYSWEKTVKDFMEANLR